MHFFNKDLFPLLNKYTIKGLDQDFFDFKNLMEDANIIKSRTYKQAWKNACQVFMKGISLCFDNLFLIQEKNNKNDNDMYEGYIKNKENFVKDVNILFRFEKVISEYYQNYKNNEIHIYKSENKYDIFSIKDFDKGVLDEFNFNEDENSDLFESKIPFENYYNPDFIFDNKKFFINNNFNDKEINNNSKINNNNNKNNKNESNNKTNNLKFKSYKYDFRKKKIKEYKFITIKRENVDKKILRKFKKFLKHKLKEKTDNEIKNYIKNNGFWPDYISMNLMPPFSYDKENISFKSFNTKYLCWFFEHKFSLELFNIFIKIKYKELLELIKDDNKLKENSTDYNLLKTYINSMPMIYGNDATRSTAFSSNIAESDQEDIKKNSEQISIEEENSSENNNNKSIDKENNKMGIDSEINKDSSFMNNNDINFDININSENNNYNNNNFLDGNNLLYNDENNTEMIISPNLNENCDNNLNNSFENNSKDMIKFDKNLFNII